MPYEYIHICVYIYIYIHISPIKFIHYFCYITLCMVMSSNENIFRIAGPLGVGGGGWGWGVGVGGPPVTGGFPSQGPVTRSFDVFFDLRLNKRLSKQWRRRWFETPSRSLRRHCNYFYETEIDSPCLC